MSRQFDVHRVRLVGGGTELLVNLQSDFLSSGPTVVAAPMRAASLSRTVPPAAVRVAFQDREHWLVLTDIAYVRVRNLGPVEGSIGYERDRIIRGLDLLFTGI